MTSQDMAKKSEALVTSRTIPRSSAALQKVFESVPVDEFKMALLESGDARAVSLAERLEDTAFNRLEFARHCFDLKLNPKDVWSILIDSRKTEARLKLSESLSQIVQSVADSAVPQIVNCPKCVDGKVKTKEGEVDCERCGGLGEMVKEPDKESQKMALEMAEMINQKVPLIAQQFNSFKGGGGGAGSDVPDMSDWSRNDSVFEEKHRSGVIEAEVVSQTE